MIVKHHSTMEAIWDHERWPNFPPAELSCRCCGEFFYDEESFDLIQKVRTLLGVPCNLNSGHRCAIHNARVGGAPLSSHKKMAFDISIKGHDLTKLFNAIKEAGFTTYGFYGTFIHVDKRPGRKWSSLAGRKTWIGLIS